MASLVVQWLRNLPCDTRDNPWSRNIPHATEPLRPGAPAADAVRFEPVLPTREATAGEAHTPQRRAAPTCHC